MFKSILERTYYHSKKKKFKSSDMLIMQMMLHWIVSVVMIYPIRTSRLYYHGWSGNLFLHSYYQGWSSSLMLYPLDLFIVTKQQRLSIHILWLPIYCRGQCLGRPTLVGRAVVVALTSKDSHLHNLSCLQTSRENYSRVYTS